MNYAVKTDIGKRDNNEDAYLIPSPGENFPFFAVSDGMGGYLAGEVASRMVVDGLKEIFTDNGKVVSERTLLHAIRSVNVSVYRLATSDITKKGMGATLVCAYVGPGKVTVANVGDSRLYRITDNRIVRVTKDQSFVQALMDKGLITAEEAKTHPRRNYILQAVGTELGVRPDFSVFDRVPGDRLILCSDGLCGVADDEDILKTALASATPEDCASALVELAKSLKSTDNITVVVVDIVEEAAL